MEQMRTVGFVIKTLSNQIKRVMDQEGREDCQDPTTGMQRWLIITVHEKSKKGDVYQRDIEQEFDIRRSTVTGIIQKMEKDGWIIRESVACDARLKKLVLTEKAERLYQKAVAHIKQMDERLTSGLTEEEIETFIRIADKIAENIQ